MNGPFLLNLLSMKGPFLLNLQPMNGPFLQVIAELRGSTAPETVVIVGAHYDSRGTQSTSPTQVIGPHCPSLKTPHEVIGRHCPSLETLPVGPPFRRPRAERVATDDGLNQRHHLSLEQNTAVSPRFRRSFVKERFCLAAQRAPGADDSCDSLTPRQL